MKVVLESIHIDVESGQHRMRFRLHIDEPNARSVQLHTSCELDNSQLENIVLRAHQELQERLSQGALEMFQTYNKKLEQRKNSA